MYEFAEMHPLQCICLEMNRKIRNGSISRAVWLKINDSDPVYLPYVVCILIVHHQFIHNVPINAKSIDTEDAYHIWLYLSTFIQKHHAF